MFSISGRFLLWWTFPDPFCSDCGLYALQCPHIRSSPYCTAHFSLRIHRADSKALSASSMWDSSFRRCPRRFAALQAWFPWIPCRKAEHRLYMKPYSPLRWILIPSETSLQTSAHTLLWMWSWKQIRQRDYCCSQPAFAAPPIWWLHSLWPHSPEPFCQSFHQCASR